MKKSISFNIIGVTLLTIMGLLCLLPLLATLMASFTEERELYLGLRLIPRKFSLGAYQVIFRDYESVLRAYGVTIFTVVLGTPLSLFFTSMAAFVLQHHEFKYKNAFSFYYYFTTLFSGGLIPYYILMTKLGFRNTIFAILLPHLIIPMYIIIMRTYFQNTVPHSLIDSAKIDGAGDFTIYRRIYIPLGVPVFATIGLFTAVGYWNEWYNAMLYITNRNLYPLQYLLYRIIQDIKFAELVAQKTGMGEMSVPTQGFRMAMTIVTIGPIILVYPFVQKYFVGGLTIGSVKG